MRFYEILLGILIIISALCVTCFTFLSKKEGKGLSAAIGGIGSTMKERKIAPVEKLFTRMVWIGAGTGGSVIIILAVISAHVN